MQIGSLPTNLSLCDFLIQFTTNDESDIEKHDLPLVDNVRECDKITEFVER